MSRETSMDGSLHVEGDCCQNRACPKCRHPQHFQGIYAGYMLTCEQCPEDVDQWEPEGTYCRECECTKVECIKRNCAWRM